ncbi:hypothetical protein KO317_02595 [Candidatus Micrarchaeota archaeon]|jgi:glutaredoxin-related protein|nr:hypothetical protein [Candidatus Micrarchaeota archaeon]
MINKKINITLILLLLISFTFASPDMLGHSPMKSEQVDLYLFWSHGCPHCEHEKDFLETLEIKYSNLNIHEFEVSRNKTNFDLMIKMADKLNTTVTGVPFTIVGDNYFKGWNSEETTGKSIEQAILDIKQTNGDIIDLPFFGEIDVKTVSLPVLTIMIAALDGFNPCAMWVLLFLITLLLGIENRFKRWLFGGVFIGASALVYFIIMAAWLNLFLLVGFIWWIRLVIGLVAIGAGLYNLKKYQTNIEGVCKVTGDEKRQKIFDNLKNIVHKEHIVFALIGLIILAFAVNVVELVCSAGFPAVYTNILSLSNLTAFEYYAYLVLYVFIFLLDDLIIFIVAMRTLEITGISTKYSRMSHLIGGILMLILGAILILKPELIMFG